MKEFKFTNGNLTEEFKNIKTKMFAVGKCLSENAPDTGFKGGIKTTSYEFTFGNLSWQGWDGDDEMLRQLVQDGKTVFRYYDCYGNGTISVDSEEEINNIFEIFQKISVDKA